MSLQNSYIIIVSVDKSLDTGPIFMTRSIEPQTDLSLVSLRYHTTILCTKMFIELIREFAHGNPQPKNQDLTATRYYNPMPWILKLRTARKLKLWVKKHQIN